MNLTPEQIAAAMGAEIVARGAPGRPRRAIIDSGEAEEGDLFFGLRGENVDGGEFAPAAIAAGAWGVVVSPAARSRLSLDDRDNCERTRGGGGAWVFAVADPLAALQSLASTWRHELGVPVVGITGSVGKTSVKDIARALLPGAVHANRENLNTEIGLPLTIL
ncbi:MAG TPA: Mur ligase domain-containing protein, partial [Solirubrobacterales bacterium]|nr:Mur ligase domain-containing protein [Solirubrobacterales bacterium]